VDDDERNLRVMEGILAPLRYDLRQARTGTAALEEVKAHPPDLVLLDVMMPGISGFEVCRQLKAHPETQFIPVVLVTALTDRESKVAGIESGADDFINKPVDPSELRARVKSLLRVKSLWDELQQRYRDLQQLEAMRESLVQMIVHDLRGPLTGISGYLQLLEMNRHIAAEKAAQEHLRALKTNVQTLIDMITAMLDLAKLEAGELQLELGAVDLGEVLSEIRVGMDSLLERGNLALRVELSAELPALWADREIVRRVLANILGNAIKFSPDRGCITITARPEEGKVRVAVQDQGPGIPPEYRERIFEKFGQVGSGGRPGGSYSTGLGLAFCKMAAEAHGGAIGVKSEVDKGSTFWFTLPAAKNP